MPDPLGTIFIDFNNLGTFASDVDKAVKPIQKLNTAVKELSKTLDKLQGGSSTSGLGALKKVAGDLGDIVKLINSQESLGRGNLENLSRTASTVTNFVKLTAELDKIIGAGGFKNIASFSEIMRSLSTALAEFDKIKRPENLVVVEQAVEGLQKILRLLMEDIPDSGNIVTRWIKTTFVLKPLLSNIASALSAFDAIKRPENMEHVATAVRAISRVVGLLDSFSLNLSSVVKRTAQLAQFRVLAAQIANALRSFDRIKKPDNITAVSSAINSLSKIIDALRLVAKQGETLAIGGIKGFFTQAGSLLANFKPFAKQLANGVKAFSKFDAKAVSSLNAAGQMIRSLARILSLIQTDVSIKSSGGNLRTAFNKKSVSAITDLMDMMQVLTKGLKKIGKVRPEQIEAITKLSDFIASLSNLPAGQISFDTASLKRTVKDLVSIAQDISKINFDASKVAAISQLSGMDLDLSNIRGLPRSNIFTNLLAAASTASNRILSTIGSMVSGVISTLGRIVSYNPFSALVTKAQAAGQAIAKLFFDISRQLSQVGGNLQNIGSNMLLSGGLLGLAQGSQVSLVADFQEIMKQIEVLGGVAGTELTKVEEFILRLGESSAFSATEVGAAVLDLSKAGLSVDQITQSLGSMLDLATAGGISVADASNIVINAVGAMGYGFEDTTMIVDTFVAAANIGVATVADLAAAFGYVGNTAGAMGQDLDQVTAALTLMIDKGIDSTRAGTALDAFMRSLIDPSEEAMGAIRSISTQLLALEETDSVLSNLGISFKGDLAGLLTDAEGNFRDLNTIIELVTIATKDWNESERAAILTQISGSANAGRALLALTGQYEDGTSVLNTYIEKQGEAASASSVAVAIMDTFKGSVETLSGAMETLVIKAFRPLIEKILNPLVKGLTVLVNVMSNLPEPVLATIAGLVGLTAIFTTLTGIALLFSGTVLKALSVAFSALGGAILAIIQPLRFLFILSSLEGIFIGVGIAVAAIIPLFLGLAGAVAFVKEGVQSLQGQEAIAKLKTALTQLAAVTRMAIKPFAEMASVILSSLKPSFESIAGGLIAGIVQHIIQFVHSLTQALYGISRLGESLKKFFGFGAITDSVEQAASTITDATDTIVKAPTRIQSAFEDLYDFATSQAGFEAGKNFLVLNSTNYDEDIANFRKMFTEAQMAKREIDGFRRVYGKTADTVVKAAEPLAEATEPFTSFKDNLAAVFSGDFVNTTKFQELANVFDQYTENPIIKALFGGQVTGQQIGLVFVAASIALKQLSNNLSGFTDTFTKFLGMLGAGEGVQKSVSTLLDNLLGNTGQLSATLLEIGSRLLGGGDLLGPVIADLATGAKDKVIDAFLRLGVLAIHWFITGFARRISNISILVADVVDRLFGTSFGEPVRKIATEFQRSVSIITTTILRLMGIVNTAASVFGLGKRGGKFGFIGSALAEALNLIGDAWKWFNDNILQTISSLILAENTVAAIQAILNAPALRGLFEAIFGTDYGDMVRNVKLLESGLRDIASGVRQFVSSITSFIAGKLSLGDALRQMVNGLLDVGRGFWSLIFKPLGTAIADGIRDVLPSIDWNSIKNTLLDSAKSALSFAGQGILWVWSTLLDLTSDITNIDWSTAWDELVNSVSSFFTAKSSESDGFEFSLSGIIDFTGLDLTPVTNSINSLYSAIKPFTDFAVTLAGIYINNIYTSLNNISKLSLGDAVSALKGLSYVLLLVGAAFVAVGITGAIPAATAALSSFIFAVWWIVPVIAVINGFIKALDNLVLVFRDLGQGDIDGAAENLLRAGLDFSLGIIEVGVAIGNFIRDLLPDEVVAVFEKIGGVLETAVNNILIPVLNDIVPLIDSFVTTLQNLNLEGPKLNDTQKALIGLATGIGLITIALRLLTSIGGITGLQVLASELGTALGVGSGGLAASAGAAAVAMGTLVLIFLAIKGAIRGLTRALPDLGQALEDLVALDIDGALQNMTEAVFKFSTGFISGVWDAIWGFVDLIFKAVDAIFGTELVARSEATKEAFRYIIDTISMWISNLWLDAKIAFYDFLATVVGGIENSALADVLTGLGVDVDLGTDKLNEIKQGLEREKIRIELEPYVARMQEGQTFDATTLLGDLFQLDFSTLSEDSAAQFTDLFTLALQQNLLQVQGDPALVDAFSTTLLQAVSASGGLSEEQIAILTGTLGTDVVNALLGSLKGAVAEADPALQSDLFDAFLFAISPDPEILGFEAPDVPSLVTALETAYGAPIETALAMFVASMSDVDRSTLTTAAGPGGDITTIFADLFAIDPATLESDLNKTFETLRGEVSPDFNILKDAIVGQSKIIDGSLVDVPGLSTATGEATTAVTNFTSTATTGIGDVRSELQGLTSDWSNLAAQGWLMTITPTILQDPMAPAEPRAKGGDVFPNQLYEVAEQGMSELLRIQGRTFLIPGEKGTVIPAEASPASNLVPNTNYGSSNQTPPNSISYVDNSYLVIDVQGSNLSQAELRELTQQVINDHETERARSINRRLRSTGR